MIRLHLEMYRYMHRTFRRMLVPTSVWSRNGNRHVSVDSQYFCPFSYKTYHCDISKKSRHLSYYRPCTKCYFIIFKIYHTLEYMKISFWVFYMSKCVSILKIWRQFCFQCQREKIDTRNHYKETKCQNQKAIQKNIKITCLFNKANRSTGWSVAIPSQTHFCVEYRKDHLR